MKYACVRCGTGFRPRKNGVYVMETMDDGRDYRIWHADLWECPICRTQIIAGAGYGPISEHYEDRFEVDKALVTHTVSGKLRSLTDA